MNSTVRKLAASLATALIGASLLAASPARAGEFKLGETKMSFAYAPQGVTGIESHAGEEDFEHELNDAWLGMPALSSDGRMVGFVIDAFVGEDGEVSEILVQLDMNGTGYAVYVDGVDAILGESEVDIGLPAMVIAALERDETILSMR